ncbi:methylenetetrahydrofolate reductase [NAD(P)H] [Rickettsiella endosymbiont of Aleochara curtula]|uniref:methylenetetrahydrofolate reductase [NAD(P)H] n=1 Tax=Rickettsiella endosymbiont of Aleochara curtula TaxID=3077936 RepID=UPI00313A9E75
MSFCQKFSFSVEVFPPKTKKGLDDLNQARLELCQLKPKYFSVTFGAGGSMQQKSLDVVRQFVAHGIAATPHISCVNMTNQRLQELLSEYKRLGIQQLLVIQGDLPSDATQREIEFNYASELITAIRKITGNFFHIIVAAYPEFHPRAITPTRDIENFKRKIEAGANSAITQFFFNSDAYYRFLEACDKFSIRIPIIPGITPIMNYQKLMRFSSACGAEIPLWLHKHLKTYSNDPISLQEIGIEFVSKLCHSLLQNGVKEFHFYTLNRAEPTCRIIQNLIH